MGIIFSNASILNLFVTVIIVVCITLVFKTSTTTNFAQTTIATFGGYLVAKLSYENNMNIWLALVIGLAVCLLMGLFIDTFIIRRAKAANPVGKQIITMGFTYILLSLISVAVQIKEPDGAIVQSNPSTVFLPIVVNQENFGFQIGGISYTWNTLICVCISLVVLAAFFILVYCTKFGLGVRMTASDETTAQMMGVNTHVITAVSWSIATMLGCLTCVFLNWQVGFLSTAIMTPIQIAAFLGCIVGGFNTFWGPAVASVIIWLAGGLVNVVSGLNPALADIQLWKDVVVYGIAMILVLIKPTGLFGKAARKKV